MPVEMRLTTDPPDRALFYVPISLEITFVPPSTVDPTAAVRLEPTGNDFSVVALATTHRCDENNRSVLTHTFAVHPSEDLDDLLHQMTVRETAIRTGQPDPGPAWIPDVEEPVRFRVLVRGPTCHYDLPYPAVRGGPKDGPRDDAELEPDPVILGMRPVCFYDAFAGAPNAPPCLSTVSRPMPPEAYGVDEDGPASYGGNAGGPEMDNRVAQEAVSRGVGPCFVSTVVDDYTVWIRMWGRAPDWAMRKRIMSALQGKTNTDETDYGMLLCEGIDMNDPAQLGMEMWT